MGSRKCLLIYFFEFCLKRETINLIAATESRTLTDDEEAEQNTNLWVFW